jgi:hypothetical protein
MAIYRNHLFQLLFTNPCRKLTETVTGVLVFATDVTEQVIAHKKIEEHKFQLKWD